MASNWKKAGERISLRPRAASEAAFAALWGLRSGLSFSCGQNSSIGPRTEYRTLREEQPSSVFSLRAFGLEPGFAQVKLMLNLAEKFVADAMLLAKLNGSSSLDPQEFTR